MFGGISNQILVGRFEEAAAAGAVGLVDKGIAGIDAGDLIAVQTYRARKPTFPAAQIQDPAAWMIQDGIEDGRVGARFPAGDAALAYGIGPGIGVCRPAPLEQALPVLVRQGLLLPVRRR